MKTLSINDAVNKLQKVQNNYKIVKANDVFIFIMRRADTQK